MKWENILKQNTRYNTLGEAKIAAKELAQQQNKVQIIARISQSYYSVEDNLSAFLSQDRNFDANKDVLTTFNSDGSMVPFELNDFIMSDRERLMMGWR
tara:strand:- start:10078 stop:10371 length:294 start_codon:yes stop_codon:yes gene_type:complete